MCDDYTLTTFTLLSIICSKADYIIIQNYVIKGQFQDDNIQHKRKRI